MPPDTLLVAITMLRHYEYATLRLLILRHYDAADTYDTISRQTFTTSWIRQLRYVFAYATHTATHCWPLILLTPHTLD